jgi:tetratricopeptide (TPR) repeat protein
MFNRQTLARVVVAVALLAPLAVHAQATSLAAPPLVRLQPTTSSDAAGSAFREAVLESHSVGPVRARARIAAAVSADPQFGLARAYQAVIAAGVTPVQREKSIGEALAMMGSASIPEVLLALYWRENAAGRGAAALPLLEMAGQLVPADTQVAYILLGAHNFGKTQAEQVANTRQFTQSFPAYGPAFNNLAYALWATGDRDGALAAVQQFVKLAPNHPNAHDSYADILLLMGKPQEALPHVQHEIELDPTFGGESKLGAILLMQGDIPGARAAFTKGIEGAATPADRLDDMTWMAATYVYAHDGKGALREWGKVADAAKSAGVAAAEANAHLRMAVLEAYLGNKTAVAGHLEAAASAQPPNAAHYVPRAIAYSRIGDAAQAKEALDKFNAAAPNNAFRHTLAAILAVDAKDVAAAEAALGQATGNNVIHNALRSELMQMKKQKKEAEALRQEAMAGSVKIDNNNTLNFVALVGRMRMGTM